MKPIKSKEFPGFYEIPGYGKYCINKKSEIKHKRKNKIINQYPCYGSNSSDLDTGYYLRVTMMNDESKLSSIGVHRLMGLTFKHPGKGIDTSTLQINHKDHIKFHNWIDNLEWITCIDNIQHSKMHYKSRKHISVQIKYVETGEIKTFNNISDAGRELGIHRTTVISRLHKTKPGHVFPEKCMMRYGNDETIPWIIGNSVIEDIETYRASPLLVKNMLTGEILEFENGKDASHHTGIGASSVSVYSNDLTQPCFWGKNSQVFIAMKKYPEKSFRIVHDPYLEIQSNDELRRIVIVIKLDSQEKRIYETTQQCATDFGLLKTTLNWRLKKEIPKEYNGWIFRYYDEAHSFRNE